MRVHVLVEGPSEAAMLRGWLPRLLPRHTFKIIQHRGKGPVDPLQDPDPRRQGLLDQLSAKLRVYGRELNPETDRVLVLVDLDDQDCTDLKSRLLRVLEACDPQPAAMFRIAIEETEAFYLGDPAAIRRAFPAAKPYKAHDYVQDSICGTWEFFSEVIGAKVEDKVGWAEKMAPHLGTKWRGQGSNASPSFRHLCRAFLMLSGEPVDSSRG